MLFRSRNRYTVPEGGYARTIHRLFVLRIHERLNGQILPDTLERLFVFSDEASAPSLYDWQGRFAEEYGAAASNGLQQTEKVEALLE